MPVFCDIVEAGDKCPNLASGKFEAASTRDTVDVAWCAAHKGAGQSCLYQRMNRHGMTTADSKISVYDYQTNPKPFFPDWDTCLTDKDVPKIAEKVAEILREKQYQELKGIFES